MKPIDVLIVGAGPAGLAAAIRLKAKEPRLCVVVIDKASRAGGHSLSGAALESACLDELLPGWRDTKDAFVEEMADVATDEMFFLTSTRALLVPEVLIPGSMRHTGDKIVSLSRMVDWLARQAIKAGVELYQGFSASSLIWEGNAVKGVRLVDQGRGRNGQPKSNFLAGESIFAKTVILADGARGVLSREYINKIGGSQNPQVYSLGIKQVFRLPLINNFGPQRVVHTLGFPNRPDVFGGGFFYSLGAHHLAAGLIVGLDCKYTNFDPQKEFELLKKHPFVAEWLKGAELVSAGAKTIPEGGFYALPKLFTAGALIIGDAAGFVNMEKIKGIHYSILTGMAAADAIIEGDLSFYERALESRGVMREMRHARNFRASFKWGLYPGAVLSQVQSLLPFRVPMKEDYESTRPGALLKRDFHASVDRVTAAALSGTSHREDEPSHLVIPDAQKCERCKVKFGAPCTFFCPTEVYRRARHVQSMGSAGNEVIRISATNCVHCGTCSVKCPMNNIIWTPPEGSEGPRYKLM